MRKDLLEQKYNGLIKRYTKLAGTLSDMFDLIEELAGVVDLKFEKTSPRAVVDEIKKRINEPAQGENRKDFTRVKK